MSTPPSLPVPRLQLVQIGQWQVPRFDATTKLTVEVKEAITDMYRAPVYDFDADRRTDLNPIKVSHEGAYSCCGNERKCNWAISEWDGIVRSMGVRTPILFYRHPYCLDCPEECVCDSLYQGAPCYSCIRKRPCGEWMWAYGTILTITNDLAAEDFRSPQTATVSLEIRLEGPLQLVTHKRWWYGRNVVITQPCQNIEQAAALVNYEKKVFFQPCGLPDCCDKNRFWPRNLDELCPDCLDCDQEYTPIFWDSRYVWSISSDTCFNLYVPGHTAPQVRALITTGTGTLTIQNATGTHTISYGATGSIYSDTRTGLIWRDPGTGYALLAGALDVVTLEPGENIITTSGTAVTLGVLPLWVN